jgi:hypothetical protein
LVLIPERLWVILDHNRDVSRREMAPKSYRRPPGSRPSDYSFSRSFAADLPGRRLQTGGEFTV